MILPGERALELFQIPGRLLFERAGPAGDDHGGFVHAQRPIERLLDLREIVGVDRAHVVDANRADEGFDIDRFGHFAVDGVAGTRVFLLTGHGGDAVVQNDGDQLAAVVGNVQQRVDAGVEEGRIAKRRDDARFFAFDGVEDLLRAVPEADAGAHADGRFDGVVRRAGRERVAADVARDHDALAPTKFIEETAMRAARAQRRRATDHSCLDFLVQRVFLSKNDLADDFGCHFAVEREDVLAVTFDPQRPHMGFDVGVVFFDDVKLVNFTRKILDQLVGQRIGEAELEVRSRFAKDFLGVEVAIPGADDADGGVVVFGAVPGAVVAEFLEELAVLLDADLARAHVGGRRDIFLNVFSVGFDRYFAAFAQFDHALGVANARRHANQNGDVVFFAELVGFDEHVLAFLAVGRLEHGRHGSPGVVAVVLLVLRGELTWLVSRDDDRASVDPDVGEGEEGVGSHVETNVLHGRDRARARDRGTDDRFEGNFLVGRPLSVDLGIACDVFKDFCAGRAGVGSGETHASFPNAAGDGFIASDELFQSFLLFRLVFL